MFFVNKMVFWFMTDDDDLSFDIPRWSGFVFIVFVQSYSFKFIMMTEWTYLSNITDNYSSWLVLIHPLPIKLRRAALKLLGSNGPIWKSCWLRNLALKCLHLCGDNFSLINPWMRREREMLGGNKCIVKATKGRSNMKREKELYLLSDDIHLIFIIYGEDHPAWISWAAVSF